MITIKEVKTRKEIRDFVNFPLRLYKGNQYFVPYLYSEELKIFTDDFVYAKTCDQVFYLAYKDGALAGRIQGFIQKQANQKESQKRVRFNRIDAIDDFKVFEALFDAVQRWGRAQGMDTICGPMGYSDAEREGLQVEGFNEMSTFEEQYSYAYYQNHIEKLGYVKEVDWVASRLYLPEKPNPMIHRVAERALELNKLHRGDTALPKKKYLDRYADGIFHCIDVCYNPLYGTVPFTVEMKNQLIEQFMLLLTPPLLPVICDENDDVIAFGLCFPSIGNAIKKSGGRLTPLALIKLLSCSRKPKVVDLGLIGVLPEYQARGINAVILDGMMTMLSDMGVEYLETNSNLELNEAVRAQWKYFREVQCKRKRAYVKAL